MFVFATDKSSLHQTRLTIAVYDESRTSTGCDLIGCAYLGTMAIDKTEIDQWRLTVNSTGREHKAVHSLKPPQERRVDLAPLNGQHQTGIGEYISLEICF
jgi:hypothetical protein